MMGPLELVRGGANPPLRTLKEMADEFGVKHQTLSGLLSTRNGPKARMDTLRDQHKAHWYEPHEMRKWWKEITK